MKTIIIAFTLKNQPFEKILPQLEKISQENHECILLHGFMPRKALEEKKIPTNVVDELERLFPVQLNMYANGAPLRKEMAEVAAKLDASVYIVGAISEGVKEEFELYKNTGLPVFNYTLE